MYGDYYFPGEELDQMAEGGIPSRYKNMGFSKVGAKKKSTRPGKKWMVLAKKGDKYKVVHGGDSKMKDFSQHGSEKRKDRFWDRMGGKDSAKANDPFSPLYWHKRFGTWAEGGEPQNEGFQALPEAVQAKIMANMMYGGDMYGMGGMPCYECGGATMKEGGTPFIAMAYFGDGGIKLDPAKKGTFKAQATRMGLSVQEAAKKILDAPEGKYSPEMRRKANFARNFAKAYGGMMEYQTGGSRGQVATSCFGPGCFKDNSAENAAYESQLDDFGKRKLAEERSNLFNVDMEETGLIQNTQMGPMLPGQQTAADFAQWYDLNNPFDRKDISYITQGRRGQPMDEDMYRLKENTSNVIGAAVDKGKEFLKDRYADYSTPMAGFKSATNAVGDALSFAGWLGRGRKESQAQYDINNRFLTDNLYEAQPMGISGERGNFDAFGNFRPDETLASRTYYNQMGGEIEMTDDQIRQLVALGAEIEILD